MDPNLNLIGSLLNWLNNLLSSSGIVDWLANSANRNPADIALDIFLRGGWVIVVIMFLRGIYFDIFLDYRAGQFVSKWKFKLLAIDIPKNNEQTPKAVENIFAALAGVYSGPNLLDAYWVGKQTESFSFEIVSIEGHTRFLLRTPAGFLDFVESVIYSQYPDAEISEVSDYVDYDSNYIDPATNLPVTFKNLKFPNPMYNLWGAEFVFVKPYPYPIRTYPEFEHQATQTFIDPMSNVLEILSRMGPGEQLWLQLVVQPRDAGKGWGEEAKKVVSKLQGRDYAPPKPAFVPTDIIGKPMDAVGGFAGSVVGQVFGSASPADKKKEEDQWKMFKMTPGERGVLEKVENKLSKQSLKVKFRMIYMGEKPVFAKGRGVTGITGALQQFNTADANSLKPGGNTKTGADYFFVNRRVAARQNQLLRWFCNRSSWYGESNADTKLTLMSPEELATLWHFPVMTVKASEVSMIGSKKSAPPSRLPYMERMAPAPKEDKRGPSAVISTAPQMPDIFAQPPQVPVAPQGLPIAPTEGMNTVEPVAPAGPSFGNFAPPVSQPVPQSTPEPIVNIPTPNQSNPDGKVESRRGAPPPNLPFAR